MNRKIVSQFCMRMPTGSHLLSEGSENMGSTKKMTITEGLVALKLYGEKIEKAILDARFIMVAKCKPNATEREKLAEFEKNAKSAWDSINKMISNRDAIKRAIVLSNATTYVAIDGKQMTVAEAIEKKNNIGIYRMLLETMERQMQNANAAYYDQRLALQKQTDKLLEMYYGKDAAKKISREDYDTIAGPYKESNECYLFSPIDVDTKYKTLKDDVDYFLSQVDTVLSISNATTFIEVEV